MIERNAVSPGLFSAMQIPLLGGREFTLADTQPGHRVAIVDQAFVNDYYGGDVQKALGGILNPFNEGHPDTRIVGIIPTLRATNLTKDPSTPFVYLPWSDTPMGSNVEEHPANFYVRTTGDPSNLVASIRALVRRIDRSLPVDGLETMRDHLDEVTFDSQLVTLLSIAMGVLALMLAAIGLYGVLAFSVRQRTREIGVRMALGANRYAVTKLVARQVARLVCIGAAAGALFGWFGTRILVSRDASLAHTPLWLFAIVGAALLFAMALATLIPARRAASVDPMQALRAE